MLASVSQSLVARPALSGDLTSIGGDIGGVFQATKISGYCDCSRWGVSHKRLAKDPYGSQDTCTNTPHG